MSHKAAIVNARIEPDVKYKAEFILQQVGLTSAEAIRLFYMQICLQKGLPFKVAIPHKKSDIEELYSMWEPHFFDFEAITDLPDFSMYRKEFKALKNQDPLA